MNKAPVLTLRIPAPIPLETACKIAFSFWMRLHINELVRHFTEYSKTNKEHEFVEFCAIVFTSRRWLINPDLN